MKTKIYVCSNSGIDYVPHSENVSSIPVVLKFSEEEEYRDFVDLTAEAFYNRIRLDEDVTFQAQFQNYGAIIGLIEEARLKGYEQLFFILSSEQFSELYISTTIATSQVNDLVCHVYQSKTIGYPLAYMAIEADRILNSDGDFDAAMERINEINRIHELFFFVPKHKEDTFLFSKQFKRGKYYSIQNGALEEAKGYTGTALEAMVKKFNHQIEDLDVTPIIMYTSKSSKYISLLTKMLEKGSQHFKKIRICPMPPAIGYSVGVGSICLGYVIK